MYYYREILSGSVGGQYEKISTHLARSTAGGERRVRHGDPRASKLRNRSISVRIGHPSMYLIGECLSAEGQAVQHYQSREMGGPGGSSRRFSKTNLGGGIFLT